MTFGGISYNLRNGGMHGKVHLWHGSVSMKARTSRYMLANLLYFDSLQNLSNSLSADITSQTDSWVNMSATQCVLFYLIKTG
jgi:hypothetical protein